MVGDPLGGRIARFSVSRLLLQFALACAGVILAAPAAGGQGRVSQEIMASRWEPRGFDFSPDGVWRVRARAVAQQREALLAGGRFSELNAPVAAGAPMSFAQAVSGVLNVPTILFKFQDTPPSAIRDPAVYAQLLFSTTPPFARPYTLRTFYEQMSNGLFSIQGTVSGYAGLSQNENAYTGCCNGLRSPGSIDSMQAGLREAIAQVDGTIDFSQYDADGNGVVDLAVFVQPAKDGACGGNQHLWAHRYVLLQPYVTNDPAPGGGTEVVRDYILQSGVGGNTACDSTQYMPIGTIAHEAGHGLGLPDLYDTMGPTSGIGEWGLMGSGNYTSPYSPSRMEAWSLNQLGWVRLAPLTVSGAFSVGPAPLADTAFVISVQGANPRNEYFLVENRQAVQSDSALIRRHGGGGLMVWHIDGASPGNYGPIHKVALEEADGLRQLWCEANGCNRGDAGDPYPGTSGNTSFSVNTNPPAIKNSDGSPVGFAIDSIQQRVPNGEMAFRLQFVQPTQLAITTQPGGAVSGWPFVQQPVVELRDANNQPVARGGVVVTATIAIGSGVLTGISSAASPAGTSWIPAREATGAVATVTATTDANGVATFVGLTITGTGSHTLSFGAPNLTNAVSGTFVVAQPVADALQNDVPVSGLAGALRSVVFYSITLPAGVAQLTVSISGGSGDADLYLRQGTFPTLSAWDCRPYLGGNSESCSRTAPAAGDWYVALHGFANYSNVTLVARYTVPTQLAILTQPGGATSGAVFTQQPVVELRDAQNQPVAQSGVVVTVVKASGAGTLSGLTAPPLTATTNANGRATFAGLAITGTGGHTLGFSSPNLTGVISASFTVAAPPATQLAIITQPGGAVSGVAFTQQPVVELRDASNQPVAQSGVVVLVILGSGSGTLSGPTPPPLTVTTDAAGRATFGGLTITGTGPHTLRFAASNIQAVTSASFTVAAPPTTQLAIITQPGGAVSGVPFTQQPVVELRDATNQPVAQSGVVVTVVKASGPGTLSGSTAPPLTATTDANGRATFSGLRIAGTGPHTLSFSAPNLTAVMSASFPVAPPPATQLAMITQPGGAVSGAVFTQQPVVEFRDAQNQPVLQSGVVVTVVKASGPGTLSGSTAPPLTATTDANGRATFSGLSITGTGAHTLSFSAPNLTQATSASFTVGAGPLIVLTPSSHTFAGTQNGSLPPSQAATVTNGGGGVLSGLVLGAITYGMGPSEWLTASLSSTTTPAAITLQPNTTDLAPGTYTATVPVTSGMASNSPQTMTVTYVTHKRPELSQVTCGLLGTCQPSPETIAYADGLGNQNGRLDLGDLVAWIDKVGGSVDIATMNEIRSRATR